MVIVIHARPTSIHATPNLVKPENKMELYKKQLRKYLIFSHMDLEDTHEELVSFTDLNKVILPSFVVKFSFI